MSPVARQWRGLDDLARDPVFVARAAKEFPHLAEALSEPHDRRRVLKLMAAGLALAGLGGCDDGAPSGVIIPPVLPPRNAVSAGNQLYATANVFGGYGTGVLIRHSNGRPIKVEGNPNHPASFGGTSAIAQAEILDFYDPDRSRGLSRQGEPQAWSSLLTALDQQRAGLTTQKGEGFRVLTGSVTSPTFGRQMAALQLRYPQMRWHRWEPVSRDSTRAGAQLAFGKAVEVVPRLEAADVIVAFDSDLLESAPGHVRHARDFAARRNPVRTARMSRIYAFEMTPTLTGVAADHRVVVNQQDLTTAISLLAAGVLRNEQSSGGPDWLAPLLKDIKAAPDRVFLHIGPHQPPELHALVHAMNDRLGGRNRTYAIIEPVEIDPVIQLESMSNLIADMDVGHVDTLLIVDSNPVFTAPEFAEAMRKVPFSMTLSAAATETAAHTTWSVPQRHAFEDWSDVRAYDGTVSIMQPQAQPLYDGVSVHTLLPLFADSGHVDSRTAVQETFRLSDQQWHDALATGIVPHTQASSSAAALRDDALSTRVPDIRTPAEVDFLFRPDPHLWDGRFANNAWLQELPRPLTKLTWENPLLLSPALARSLAVASGDLVSVRVDAIEMAIPVWIMPGQARNVAVALLGGGRHDVGMVGKDVGTNVYPLMAAAGAVRLRKVDGRTQLASTEHHDPIFAEAGDFVRHGTLASFQANPHFLASPLQPTTLYNRALPGPAVWGMSIDLNACIGCNACVVACQAENNIPVVGKEQVLREREMQWLRIDRYYEGDPEAPDVLFQPVLCQHCETAPCEIVCPVGATMHDSEGLNVMVYNRCVGTRFCSNNCPYKVRRFNYADFTQTERRPAVARNPDVTVRARGVMEKCTFCLQRIAAARIDADIAGKPVGGDGVKTACQAVCPSQAISFGNMAEPSNVADRKQSPLNYALLEDQGTRPRVTYEARITNPPGGEQS